MICICTNCGTTHVYKTNVSPKDFNCDDCGHGGCATQYIDSSKNNTTRDEEPLLRIELQDESSVPKVFYKGEEITFKHNVFFDWDTEDAHSLGGLTYGFEHVRSDGAVERIGRRTKDHR